jgi:hypothetical protein
MNCFAFFLLTLLADIDFSSAEPGSVRDRLNPSLNPGFVRTENIYSRRLGDALDIDPRFEHPRYALGRDGKISAVKSGNARNEIPHSAPQPITLPDSCTLPTNAPSTQILWFYILDCPVEDAYVRLTESLFGYRIGFRLDWIRAGWMKSGGVNFVYGDGDKSKSISSYSKKACPVEAWHQVAIVNDGKEFELYLDGVSLGKSEGNYIQDNKPLRVRLASASDEVSFKTDSYKLYARALSASEIEKNWKDGISSEVKGVDEMAEIKKLPVIKNSRSGIFSVGEKIEIAQNGKVVEIFSYDKTGVYEKIFNGRHFPLCILPVLPIETDIGAVDLLNRQPELIELGIKKTLVKISWKTVEPEKNAYDWNAVDCIDDECRKANIKAVFVLTDEPDWYKNNLAESAKSLAKIRAYAEARYEMRLVSESDIGYVNPTNVKDIDNQIKKLRKEGKSHIFFKTRPPEWLGKYADSFEGRPSSAVLAIGEYLAWRVSPLQH